MHRSMVGVSLVLWVGTAFGQVPNGVSIMGDIDCGKWVKARKENRAQYLENYLTGFVDGLALGRFVEIWKVDGVTVTAIQAHLWMDKFCGENPLERVTTGAVQLANERTRGEFGKAFRAK
jgi:hypothetical protein